MEEISSDTTGTLVPNRHLDDPVREVDLAEASQDAWAALSEVTADHTAVTLVKQPGLRVLLLVLERGAVVPEHTAEGDLALQVLRGRIALRLDGEHRRVKAGQLIALRREMAHEVEALEDSELLLHLSWPP